MSLEKITLKPMTKIIQINLNKPPHKIITNFRKIVTF